MLFGNKSMKEIYIYSKDTYVLWEDSSESVAVDIK